MSDILSGVLPILFIFGLGLLGWYWHQRDKNLARKYCAKKHWTAVHMYGLPNVPEKEIANLLFADDRLVVLAKKKEFNLPYEKLTAVQAVRQTDLLQKDRSVIGRGIAGGLLLGPIGAVVGGMSAVGRKKNAKGDFLVFNYSTSDQEEPKVLIFNTQKFSKAKEFEKFVLDKRPDLVDPQQITL